MTGATLQPMRSVVSIAMGIRGCSPPYVKSARMSKDVGWVEQSETQHFGASALGLAKRSTLPTRVWKWRLDMRLDQLPRSENVDDRRDGMDAGGGAIRLPGG